MSMSTPTPYPSAIDCVIKALQNDGRDNEILPGTNLRPIAERIIAALFDDGFTVTGPPMRVAPIQVTDFDPTKPPMPW